MTPAEVLALEALRAAEWSGRRFAGPDGVAVGDVFIPWNGGKTYTLRACPVCTGVCPEGKVKKIGGHFDACPLKAALDALERKEAGSSGAAVAPGPLPPTGRASALEAGGWDAGL